MTWHFSKVSLLYAKEPTAGWLRHAIEGIDESLATLCRQHWADIAPQQQLARVAARSREVRITRALAAGRVT